MNFVPSHPDEKLAGSPGRFNDLSPLYQDVLESQAPGFLTVSYQGTGKNFVVEGAGTLDLLGTNFAKPNPETSSQVRLITNIAERDVEATFDQSGLIRLWTNFGTLVSPNLRNISAKVKTDTTFSRVSYTAGFDWSYKGLDLSTGLHMKKDSEPFLNQRLGWSKGNFEIDAVCKLSLATFLFRQINILGSYSYQNYIFWLGQNFSLKSKSVLAALYRGERSNSVFKATLSKDYRNNLRLKCTLGTIFRVDNRTILRASANTHGDLATSASYVVNDNLRVSVGSRVNVTEPSTFSTTTVIPVPIGLSLDFTYN